MSQVRISVRLSRPDQGDLREHAEHASALPGLLRTVGLDVGRQAIIRRDLDTFALYASRSIHYTLYAIADVVLAAHVEIADITLTMLDRPYRPADMFRADVENPDELFVAMEQSCGVVEVTVERDAGALMTPESRP